MHIKRIIPLEEEVAKKSILLLGPRRTGKSELLDFEIKASKTYNLLFSDVFLKLSQNPSLIRQSISETDRIIVIDEIQKLPVLMDEVHYLIEKFRNIRFILSGSSARKLKRTHTSLMAGRAKSMRLFPFISAEIPDFDLENILLHGSLPPVYLSQTPWEELLSYVGDYLKEEIQAEAYSRNISNFSRFLKTAAISNTELLNFESIASDAQVSPKTVRDYYHVLEDTLIGTMLEPFNPKKNRKFISKGKFYFFDSGVVNALVGQKSVTPDTSAFGKQFEQFIFQELFAYINYKKPGCDLNFWRTHQGEEVDFLLDDSIAVEVKATQNITERHLKGLKALHEHIKLKRKIIVSRDTEIRKIDDIEIIPYRIFLNSLWSGGIIA